MPKAAGDTADGLHPQDQNWLPSPALAGLEHECGTCQGHEGKDEAEGLSSQEGLHHQSHRIPAPIDRAMTARSVNAQVKRARFAFTRSPFMRRT